MDLVAHGLWAVAAGKFWRRRTNRRSSLPLWAAFGVLPDALTFLPIGVWVLFTGKSWAWVQHYITMSPAEEAVSDIPMAAFTFAAYSTMHSIVGFAVGFGLLWLVLKRPVWESLGWLLRILLDIPTHGTGSYGTRFLWPISTYVVNGVYWQSIEMLIVNYLALLCAFLWLYATRQ